MNISDIQKKRFLETIYKIYYSLGSAPSDNEVSLLYGRYFSSNPPGEPIRIPYDDLSTNQIIDQDKLNKIMAYMILNIDNIYEAYHDHVQDLYDLITSYTKRVEAIRSKRAEVEKRVDDQLFAINNSDGFYYSVTNAFNNLDLVDINYTTALIDTEVRKASIPKVTSGLFDYVGNILNKTNSASVSVIFDGSTVQSSSFDFSNVFNGLSNSDWVYRFNSQSIGLCTLKIVIPIASSIESISLVEGKIKSIKPVEIGVIIVNPSDINSSLAFTKSSSSDYDRFSFHFSPILTNSIEIYLTKSEPDYVTNEQNNFSYTYEFRIDELIITSPYYDASATLVSNPISLPSQNNSNLVIDAVSLTVQDQVPSGSDIRYYVAKDNPSATNVYDFNWFSISPSNVRDAQNPVVINFDSSVLNAAALVNSTSGDILSTNSFMYRIPRTERYNNPIKNYFYASDKDILGFNVYRMAKFPQGIKPYDCYILENVDKNQLTVNIVPEISLDKSSWQSILTGQRSDFVPISFTRNVDTTDSFFVADNIPFGSIHISTNVFCQESLSITELFLKSLQAQYWNIKIYLNGVDLTATEQLSPGILSSNVTWNFKKGKNELVMVINKSTNDSNGIETPFNGTISILKDKSILSLPGVNVFKNYLFEVKIEDLRTYYSNNDNVFSIINYENNYEIVYRRESEIKDGSKVYYYYNKQEPVEAVRLRADLFRGDSFNSAPSINSYTLKFKH
jgi:hypothetical protein